MRILIDLQCCQSGSRLGGIGRYSLSLAKAMLGLESGHEFSLLLNARLPHENAIRAEFAGLLPQRNIHTFSVPPFVAGENELPAHTQIAELIREKYIAEIAPDVLHIASLFEGSGEDVVTSIGSLFPAARTVVTLYDLIPFLERETYLGREVIANFYLRKFAQLKKAGMLLSISDFSREEALQHADVAPDRIVNISSAVNGQFAPEEIDESAKQRLLGKFGIDRPFVLFTSRLESRKNHERLVEAFAKVLPSLVKPCQLVIVGKGEPRQVELLQSLALDHGLNEQDLVFVGHVSDDELVGLYNLCTLFVFPSLREGFGLPVLEAMSCGAATIGSNCTSVPEVIGRSDALFDPTSVDDIAARMHEFLTNDVLREQLRLHGLRKAEQFSWEQSARRALDAIEKLCGTSPSTGIDAAATERDETGSSPAIYARLLAELSAHPVGRSDEDFLRGAAHSIAVNELRERISAGRFKSDISIGCAATHVATDEMKESRRALSQSMIDAVVIRAHDVLCSNLISDLAIEQRQLGRMVFVALASTKGLDRLSPAERHKTRQALKACDGVFVRSMGDVGNLEGLNIWRNVALMPKASAPGRTDAGHTSVDVDGAYLLGRISLAVAESQFPVQDVSTCAR